MVQHRELEEHCMLPFLASAEGHPDKNLPRQQRKVRFLARAQVDRRPYIITRRWEGGNGGSRWNDFVPLVGVLTVLLLSYHVPLVSTSCPFPSRYYKNGKWWDGTPWYAVEDREVFHTTQIDE